MPAYNNRGVKANQAGRAYTLPAIKTPSGEVIMDSSNIIKEVESLYPEPSLHLEYEHLARVDELRSMMQQPLTAAWAPYIPSSFLSPISQEYFQRTRAVTFGKPLEELAAEGVPVEGWDSCKNAALEMSKLLEANGGPYFLGKTRK
jgi:glutathione S-transferase